MMQINMGTDTPGVCEFPIPPLSLSAEFSLFLVYFLEGIPNEEKSLDIQHAVYSFEQWVTKILVKLATMSYCNRSRQTRTAL